jgi:type IV pilus assembly protein PilA
MNLKDQSGFTLLELIVVVALVGILSALAIPNYMRIQTRARSAEARIALAAIYMGEMIHHSEHRSYTACVADVPSRLSLVGIREWKLWSFGK